MLNITGGPPLKRQQSLSAAIKHPLGWTPVACQLLTLVAQHPVRGLTLSDALKDGVSLCCMSDVFVDVSFARPPIVEVLSPSYMHFLAFSSLFLLGLAISHMVANKHNNVCNKTEAQEGSA